MDYIEKKTLHPLITPCIDGRSAISRGLNGINGSNRATDHGYLRSKWDHGPSTDPAWISVESPLNMYVVEMLLKEYLFMLRAHLGNGLIGHY